MPSRREIREAVVQFLYCADLEGGAHPAALREPFWEFVTESDRRALQVATFKTLHHLAHGRELRVVEFLERKKSADALLSAHPEAEKLKLELARIEILELRWTDEFRKLEMLPRDDANDTVADRFAAQLAAFFSVDRDLAASRQRFLLGLEDFPQLRGPMEAISAAVRRLQRVSDRLRMVEEPERFPEQADLAKLRDSRSEIIALREQSDALVDAVLAHKESVDQKLSETVANYVPERIDPVDRAILRLAAFELMHQGLPAKVAISEAVDLAKRFGTTDSGRFVNGVLDALARSAGMLA